MLNVRTYDELVSAISHNEDNINITKDILINSPIEISECSGMEISSHSGCALIGGITDLTWENEGDYLSFKTETEPRILIINGNPVKKTSFPENGFLELTDISSYTWMNSRNGGWDKKPSHYDLTHITVKPENIPEGFDIGNCDIRVIHQWDESTVSISGYDTGSGIIECKSEMAHPAGAFGKHKYQLLNTAYGAPQKGRWFYDRINKKIYYCPADNETAETISAMIPISQSVIIIKNSNNIKISNLKFMLSNSETGFISGLRAVNPRGTLQIEDSKNIILDKLNIAFSGGQGIKCLRSKNVRITNSTIENCSSCGIATFECEDELISHNVIQNIGLSDFSAVSVHAGGKSELVYVIDGCKEEHGQTIIEHNTIDGSPYCGISCNGGPHIIRNNKVTRCMQTLKDGGAVYCSRAEGTIISGNFVSDVPSDTAYAFYLDELSKNCILDGNVSLNVNIPFNAHIAEKCTLSNNLFINDDETTVRLMRSVGFTFSNNIFISKGKFIIGIKSYNPEEKFTLEECVSFDRDVVSAPAICTDNGEIISLNNQPLTFIKENDRFILNKSVNKISNRYIIIK